MDRSSAAQGRLTRPQREALAMLRRSAHCPSTDTGLLTAKALAQRGLIEWGEYVGPEEGGYVLHLTEAGRG